jgi:nicotinamide-nucleotide amidase
MRAEVVAVGTELVLGDVPNSNAQAIARELARVGVDCHRHTAVGDNVERIADALADALARADAVVVTGGLGPTQDDVTREAVARLTGQRLVLDEGLARELRSRFERMGRPMPASNLRQAERPEGARPIPNPLGTAPGLLVEHRGKPIYLLPGVPSEMEAMLRDHVVPDLERRAGEGLRIVSRVVRVAGVPESAVAEALVGAWERLEAGSTTMAFLAGGGEVRVRLTAKAASERDAAARLDAAEREVRTALGVAVVGTDDETLEAVVIRLLGERGLTLGCAESVTGGMVAARITDVPGASAVFRGGVVAYAPEVKAGALGVDPGLIATRGVVSPAVARAMAEGAQRLLGSDVAVATTGAAGPTPHGDVPVGTVALAVAGPDGEAVREVRLPGDRATVRRLATTAALNLVRLHLLGALER